ncbi:MAG: hypothetical protein PVI99_06915 [Anaerolineales bacterium]|jgi:hypothetical protein
MLEEVYPNEGIEAYSYVYSGRRLRLAEDLPSLEAVLADQRGLPPFSLLLGLCDDTLPLVLDLTDASSGAFLIAGDNGFDNTTLMHSILSAAFKANKQDEVNLHLISPHADDLLHFHRQPSFKISYEPFRPEVAIVLEEMVNLVSGRRQSRKITPVHLFAIDGLDLLWQTLGPQARLHLDWLVEHGPQVGLWVFASIESTYISSGIVPTLDRFPSRILGRISQPNLARYLSGLSRSYLSDLVAGAQYFVRTCGNSFNIWMLQSEEIEG